jgi:hypothetical protein
VSGLYRANAQVAVRDEQALAYVAVKASRIGSALLMVIERLKGHPTLAAEIEKTSVGLVRAATEVHQSERAVRTLGAHTTTLACLLTTLVRAGLLSESTGEVMIGEMRDLVGYVAERAWERGVLPFPEGYFAGTRPDEHGATKDTYGGGGYRGHNTDMGEHERVRKETRVLETPGTTQGEQKVTSQRAYVERAQDAQKDRRATILGMLQRKDRVTVRDVAHVIKDCSEKTLQRELLALVAQGVLVKEGERRWSTYRLA